MNGEDTLHDRQLADSLLKIIIDYIFDIAMVYYQRMIKKHVK